MSSSPLRDANSFSLDRRNFDVLGDKVAPLWRSDFLKCRRNTRPKPNRLIVEILNSCNLDCPMCRVGQHGVDLTRSMSLCSFREILDQVEGLRTVRLNGLGESTLVPNFTEYLEELHIRSINVELITNGTGSVEDYRVIIDRDGKLYFSWDAASKELFEKLRRPANWERTLENLRTVCKHSLNTSNGQVGLLFTLQKANIAHFSEVVTLAGNVGASSVQMNVVKGGTNKWVKNGLKEIGDEINKGLKIGETLGVTLYIPDQINGHECVGNVQSTSGTYCSVPNSEAVVRWNGDVQVCNMFNPFVIGNALDGNFEQAWDSSFASLFLKKLNSNEKHPYCNNCAYMSQAYD